MKTSGSGQHPSIADTKNSSSTFDQKISQKNELKTHSSSDDSKPHVKSNPFAKVSKHGNSKEGSDNLPPLRKNIPKEKKLSSKSNAKFKSKFQVRKSFNGKPKTSFNGDSNIISDERLKAYGINPKKFHKKQKYGKAN